MSFVHSLQMKASVTGSIMPSALARHADYRILFKANGTFSNGVSCRSFSCSSVLGGTLGIKYKVFNGTTDSWRIWLLLGEVLLAARSSPRLLLANFFIVLEVSSGHGLNNITLTTCIQREIPLVLIRLSLG